MNLRAYQGCVQLRALSQPIQIGDDRDFAEVAPMAEPETHIIPCSTFGITVELVVQNEENGRVTNAGDSVDLAQVTGERLGDPTTAASFAAAGHKSAQARFDWPGVAEDYCQIYDELIHER